MFPRVLATHRVALAAFVLAACSGDRSVQIEAEPPEPVAPHEPTGYANWPDPLATLPRGLQQIANVCARGGQEYVRDVFCSGAAPGISSLVQLQAALGVDSGSITNLLSDDARQRAIQSIARVRGRPFSAARARRCRARDRWVRAVN